jgi:two-component system, sensor histidine kinase
VQRLGGQIDVLSTPGEGSTFRVELPLRRVAAMASGPALTEPGALPPVREALHVLVAEDNAVNQVLAEALLSHLGHRSHIVANGLEAVAAVQAAPEGGFDLVLMDMQMPELDGLQATRRIRALPGGAARVPIVAMTANAREEDRQACLAAGMDDFVAKPIDFEVLGATLGRFAPRATRGDAELRGKH